MKHKDNQIIIDYVKENYINMTSKEIAEKFNCPVYKIDHIASKLKINKRKIKKDDKKDNDINYKKNKSNENKSNEKNEIKNYRKEFIKEHYLTMTNKEMAVALGCSEVTVTNLSMELKLNKKQLQTIKRNEKKEFIKEHYLTMSNREMAKALGCSLPNIEKLKCELKVSNNDLVYAEKIDNEIFKKLSSINCNNYYISNYGRLINKDNVLLKYIDTKAGYYMIRLFDDNHEYKNLLIHRLVALMFVDNDDIENKIQVNHIDGNKHNNNADNLEWVTPSQNTRHAIENGLIIRKGKNGLYAKYTEQDVRNVCEMLQEGKSNKEIIQKYPQYSRSWIRTIKNRRNWKDISKDYNW